MKYIYLKFIKWEKDIAIFTKKVSILDKVIWNAPFPLNNLLKLLQMEQATSLIIKIPKELEKVKK